MENPIIESFIKSGLFGKTILLSLLGLSIYVWTIVQSKFYLFRTISKKTKEFLEEYNKIGENIFQVIPDEDRFEGLPMFELFRYSRTELTRIMEEERSIETADADGMAVELTCMISESKRSLEEGVIPLATITNIAPFMGLLGTVWGIMDAFLGMGKLGNASIAAVAPGISESLVNTSVSLLVAIPSSIVYNFCKSRVNYEISVLNDFAMEIIEKVEKKYITRGHAR